METSSYLTAHTTIQSGKPQILTPDQPFPNASGERADKMRAALDPMGGHHFAREAGPFKKAIPNLHLPCSSIYSWVLGLDRAGRLCGYLESLKKTKAKEEAL